MAGALLGRPNESRPIGAADVPSPDVPGVRELGVVDGVGDTGVGAGVAGAGAGSGTTGAGGGVGRGAGAAPGITGPVGSVGTVVGVGALGAANGATALGAPDGGVGCGTTGVGGGVGGGVSVEGTWLSGAGAMFVPGDERGVAPAGPLPVDEVPYEGVGAGVDPNPPGGEAKPPVAGIDEVWATRDCAPCAGACARPERPAQVHAPGADVLSERTTSGGVAGAPTSRTAVLWPIGGSEGGGGSFACRAASCASSCSGVIAGGVVGSKAGGSVGFLTRSSSEDESCGLAGKPDGEISGSEVPACPIALREVPLPSTTINTATTIGIVESRREERQ